jgi:hypothetical protein
MEDFDPDPGGVDPGYARRRIQEKVDGLEDERQREGLEVVFDHLRENEVDPGVQLHYVSAVVQLSRLGEETQLPRLRRGEEEAKRTEGDE